MLKLIQLIQIVYLNMRTFITIILSVLVIQSGLLAQQTGSISGRITDKSNNEELIGANVMVVGTTMKGASIRSGR
ncbi:MAG: carboxypeptidase-like regulatory domain-containing protein [Ignavibacteriales bacterium]|nr:carboxypeptidase-like regulatory domain-containing protein [Ignavibacteriales bacterium]